MKHGGRNIKPCVLPVGHHVGSSAEDGNGIVSFKNQVARHGILQGIGFKIGTVYWFMIYVYLVLFSIFLLFFERHV